MKKILTVFGTRPEAIKMASIIREMKRFPENIKTFTVVSAQHRQMLDQVLNLFEIKPDFDLNLMQKNQSLSDLTSRILLSMTQIIQEMKPDRVLVQGDTTTTFAAALAAFYCRVPVGHIEAGLRTGDFNAPWPEEMNRTLTARIADLHFAPTEANKNNLVREGVAAEKIFVTGNTGIDALFDVLKMIEGDLSLQKKLKDQFDFIDSNRKLIVITGHRRENFGNGMKNICDAILRIAERPDVQIVYPVHLNPNIQEPVNNALAGHKRIHLIQPLDYLPFIYLISKSHFVLTDSGGLQEEAPSMGKPVLVMRSTTERQEGVAAGTVALVGTDIETIVSASFELLDEGPSYQKMCRAHNPYGDGHASEKIVGELLK